MNEEFSETYQIDQMKRAFEVFLESLFNEPKTIYRYVEAGHISKAQASKIRKSLNTFNYYSCLCCRKFDRTKLTLPVEEVLEPLIDIIKLSLKQKHQ